MTPSLGQVVFTAALAVPVLYIVSRYQSSDDSPPDTNDEPRPDTDTDNGDDMSSNLIPASSNSLAPLPPPKDDPFTLNQLKEFDGNDSNKPIYISIKGM